MFDLDKVYTLYFFVKHFGTSSPRENCSPRQLNPLLIGEKVI